MNQRTLLVIAAALTAFALVIAGGVAALVSQPQALAAQPTAVPAAEPSEAALAAVSPDMARAIALAAAPGSVVLRDPELVLYQGAVAYEVALNSGAVYVDANSGAVLANTAVAQPQAPRFGEGEEDEHEEHEAAEDEYGEFEDD
jgi:hypothetical protein